MKFRDLFLAAAALWSGCLFAGNTLTIPPASYQAYVDGNPNSPLSGPGTYNGTYSNSGSGASFTNTATLSTAPAFSISGSATNINVQTSTQIVYFFEVVNSSSTAVAPVNLTLTATMSGSASVSSAGAVAEGGGEIDIPQILSGLPALTTFCGGVNEGGGCSSSSQTITYNNAPFTINANQVNEVYMTLNGGTGSAGGTYSAMIDPVISISASQPNAGNYSIIFSQGIENVPVPLPASAWLLMGGLVGFGALARRRCAA